MYYKIFDKCDVVYIKNKHGIENIIESLKGKIVISDFKELVDVFNCKGIIHILNVDNKCMAEKIDCIVCGKRNNELELKLISLNSNAHVLYNEGTLKKWCHYCHTVSEINDNNIISKYCSDVCMNKHSKFMQNFKDVDITEKLKDKQSVIIEFEKNVSNSDKKINENKFQTSIVKDAIRLEYAIKREVYKKEMRQPSLRRASSSIKKSEVEKSSNICRGYTKKGEKCNNKTVGSSNYCGIASHAK